MDKWLWICERIGSLESWSPSNQISFGMWNNCSIIPHTFQPGYKEQLHYSKFHILSSLVTGNRSIIPYFKYFPAWLEEAPPSFHISHIFQPGYRNSSIIPHFIYFATCSHETVLLFHNSHTFIYALHT